jgi:chromosome segregation ATPase
MEYGENGVVLASAENRLKDQIARAEEELRNLKEVAEVQSKEVETVRAQAVEGKPGSEVEWSSQSLELDKTTKGVQSTSGKLEKLRDNLARLEDAQTQESHERYLLATEYARLTEPQQNPPKQQNVGILNAQTLERLRPRYVDLFTADVL